MIENLMTDKLFSKNSSKGKTSVRTAIVLILVFIVLTVSGLVTHISFINGRRAVRTLVKKLNHESGIRVLEHLSNFFIPPANVVGLNAKLIGSNAVDHRDKDALFKQFYDQASYMKTINSFYFGNTDGGIINAGRDIPTEQIYTIYTEGFKKGRFYKYALDKNRNRTELKTELPFYDATIRPWYKNALTSDSVEWSKPYILATGQDIVLTASKSVYDHQGRFLGVVAVDIFLSHINNFLKKLYIDEKDGFTFIIDKNGYILASSDIDKVAEINQENNTFSFVHYSHSDKKLIKSVSENIFGEVGPSIETTDNFQKIVKINKINYIIEVTPFNTVKHFNSFIVRAIPENIYMGRINAINQETLVLILGAVLLAIFIGIYISGFVTKPILELDKKAELIAAGEWSTELNRSWIKEIDDLTMKFEIMSVRLKQTMEQLKNELDEKIVAEKRIADEKEKVSVTLTSIGDGVITTDVNGQIVLLNKVAEELTGWKMTDAVGKKLSEVFVIYNEITGEVCENPVDKVLSSGVIVELANHTVLVSKIGEKKKIADSGAPIRDNSGQVIGVVLVFRDVTEKEMIFERVRRAEKLESLGLLAGGIAHDFNNLLTGLFGYLDLARVSILTGNNESVGEYIDGAIKVFTRSKDLARQLLTFSKGGAPNKSVGNIAKLIKDSASFILSGSNIKATYNISEDLWNSEFDHNQLGQVFDNILINAKQAIKEYGEVIIGCKNISVTEKSNLNLPDGDYIMVSIKDTGPGIPSDVLNKIFDPFFTTKKHGNGLGLATTYSIISKHGGLIEAFSKDNNGAEFVIYLPRSNRDDISIINTLKRKRHVGSGLIYILDDEDYILQIASEMFAIFGYRTEAFKNGDELLDHLKNIENKNDLKGIFLDLTIPGGKGGKEIISDIRSIYPNLPVIASSGYADDPVISAPVEYGFTASISKPYTINELANTLEKHLK